MTNSEDAPRYDVAVSFAGPDRPYVLDVVSALKAAGIRVFYDDDEADELWGADLFTKLDEVYRKEARFVIMFLSHHYIDRTWTDHERESAQARALLEDRPYLLPIRLDDTEVPGIRPTTGYLDARRIGIDGVVKAFQSKLAALAPEPHTEAAVIPATPAESDQVEKAAGPAWEYLLYAGEVGQRFAALEPRFRDLEIHYAAPTGRALYTDEDCIAAIEGAKTRALQISASFNRILSPEPQEAAFGAPGEPGDANRIRHLATRLATVCADFLDLADDIRGTGVPSRWQPAFDTLAMMAEAPVTQIRAFVPTMQAEIARIPEWLGSPEPRAPLHIEVTAKLDLPDGWAEELEQHIRAAMAD